MILGLSEKAIATAKAEYDRLSFELEKKYPHHFVAIDPFSKQYFIGYTLAEAMRNAKNELPDSEFYAIKIGSTTTLRF